MHSIKDNYIIVPPDRGWSWAVCFASFMVQFFTDGSLYCFPTFEKDVEHYLSATESQITTTDAIVSFFYFFGGPIASALVHEWGCRVVGVIGGLLGALGYFLCSFLTYHYSVLYILQGFIGGMGLGFTYLCANVAVGMYFEKWRGLATGIGASGTGMGQIVIYPVIGAIEDKWGWRTSFVAIGMLLCVTSIMALFYLPLEPILVTSKTDLSVEKSKPIQRCVCKKKKKDEKGEESNRGMCKRIMSNLFDARLLKSPAFWIYLWSGFLHNGGMMGALFIIQHRATDAFGYKDEDARTLMTAFGACNLVFRIISGFLPRIRKVNVIIFCATSIMIAAISFFATSFSWAKDPVYQYANSCIFGIFMAPYCLRPLIAIDLFGLQHLTNSFGLQMLAMGLGVTVEILLKNYILDISNKNYKYASGLILAFFIGSCLTYFILRPVRNWEMKKGILVD